MHCTLSIDRCDVWSRLLFHLLHLIHGVETRVRNDFAHYQCDCQVIVCQQFGKQIEYRRRQCTFWTRIDIEMFKQSILWIDFKLNWIGMRFTRAKFTPLIITYRTRRLLLIVELVLLTKTIHNNSTSKNWTPKEFCFVVNFLLVRAMTTESECLHTKNELVRTSRRHIRTLGGPWPLIDDTIIMNWSPKRARATHTIYSFIY